MIVKRLFDIFFSLTGLIIIMPLFVIVSILIKIDSKGPVFFRQKRIGKNFKEFEILKFRSMVTESANSGPQITVAGDARITSVGKHIRKYKIDELPQLINVLKGDMSFVGPRPEVRKYVELFRSDYEKLLKIRPGITDPASIKYSDEETIISSSEKWEEDYIKRILPEKIKLSLMYNNGRKNIIDDLSVMLKTIIKI